MFNIFKKKTIKLNEEIKPPKVKKPDKGNSDYSNDLKKIKKSKWL